MIVKLFKKRLTRIASLVSLCVSLTLMCIKVFAWLKTGSIALLASAADGLVDLLASIVTLMGVYYAQRPADYGHRFGHGKAEAIAAFMQAILLAAGGIALGIESISRLITSKPLITHGLDIIVIVVSTLCASLLVIIQTLVIKYTESTAISADRSHYIIDIAVNIAALCALVLEHQFGWIRADASGALTISCYMICNAYGMIRTAMLQLLDCELNNTDRQRITIAVLNCPGVEGVHDLRTRNSGDRIFVELHVEVDGQLTINVGHAICDSTEAAVRALFSAAEVSAHLEPTGITDKRLDDLIK